MAERKKTKKQIKNTENNAAPKNRAAQLLFVIFAVLIIISMVLSATTSF
ncbi:MAG: hypothetical protein Q8L87_18875 [Anaerolineales bacterium]|jgi:hypothetical protein|nr:hypothetical protein [Anaerolineales bacterium]